MKKINSLAKILFFFFAIVSFSLVIVSCNDDEEDVKTTTSTTEEEDDEDLDSIPIEEMTLEQRRKVFIGSWESLYDQYYELIGDTLTFYKNGLVKQVDGHYDGATFELYEDDRGRQRIVFHVESTGINKDCIYQLVRNEGNIYEVTFKNFSLVTDDLMIHDVTYRKIQ